MQLALSPVVGALAAGCRVVLKPSEHVPRTASAICAAVARHLDPDLVVAVEGDADEAAAMTGLAFDKLLFTGSAAIGRRVGRTAADNLVPVVLELGGKSPAIVDPSADLGRAAADIVAGKLLNAGQTCVAPDYVLVPRASMHAFVEAARAAAARLLPDPNGRDVTAICRPADRVRLAHLIAGTDTIPLLEGEGAYGVQPCLVVDPPLDGPLMTEEIFGPVLPLVPYDSEEEVFTLLAGRPVPLALYCSDVIVRVSPPSSPGRGRVASRSTTPSCRSRSKVFPSAGWGHPAAAPTTAAPVSTPSRIDGPSSSNRAFSGRASAPASLPSPCRSHHRRHRRPAWVQVGYSSIGHAPIDTPSSIHMPRDHRVVGRRPAVGRRASIVFAPAS